MRRLRRVLVKPAFDGVKDELNRLYPKDGVEVNKTPFVIRLLREGALTEFKRAKSKPKKEVSNDE